MVCSSCGLWLDLRKLTEEARKKGLAHLSISPIGKDGWQVAVRYAADSGYHIAIEDDVETAISEAFKDPKLRGTRVDVGSPPEVEDDEDINSLI